MSDEKREAFLDALTEYLVGPHSVDHSIRLRFEESHALIWQKVRTATPLFGYPKHNEAKEILRKFLGWE